MTKDEAIDVTPPGAMVATDSGYSGSDISAADLKKKLKNVTEKTNVIEGFIKENFIEGIDFAIAFPGSEKKTLTKAGSEKICLLFNVQAKFRKDEETLSMLGDVKGVIAYVCELVDRKSGSVVSEGRGACTIEEKSTYDKYNKVSVAKINTSIKIAQKRAKVDAVLNMAGLSDRFVQDRGDDEQEDEGMSKEARALIEELAKVAPKRELYDKIVAKITDPKKKWSTLEHRTLQKAAMDTLERIKRVETQKAATSGDQSGGNAGGAKPTIIPPTAPITTGGAPNKTATVTTEAQQSSLL